MRPIISFLFPLVMLIGLVVSAFVIVTSVQAAVAPPVAVVAPAQAPAPAAKDAELDGEKLFVAKGCIVCHRNDKVRSVATNMIQFDDIPNLTNLKGDPNYFRRWLNDPKVIKPTANMPNLNLSDAEINALVTFLLAPRGK